jgi:hypothetical protein
MVDNSFYQDALFFMNDHKIPFIIMQLTHPVILSYTPA